MSLFFLQFLFACGMCLFGQASMMNSSEDIIDWKDEAQAIINDVGKHVKQIAVSTLLKSNSHEIFLNLKTLENEDYCLRASNSGFQIVAKEFDKVIEKEQSDDEEECFETPYALLNKISQSYVKSFANQLTKQLEDLNKDDE